MISLKRGRNSTSTMKDPFRPRTLLLALVVLVFFSFTISSKGPSAQLEQQTLIDKLQAKIDQLEKELATATAAATDEIKLSEPKRTGVCDLEFDLAHLRKKGADYPRQRVFGPMQADEMLAVFSLIRTSFIRRVLEIGGYQGDSAFNFLEALRCKPDSVVYTVDLNPVKQWNDHPISHKTFVKDAATVTRDDVDGEALDAILLDCHAFYATQKIVKNILEQNLLSRHGVFILHDTGLHPLDGPTAGKSSMINQDPPGVVHQPVERLIAQWIQQLDCSFQRISIHDDTRTPFRHGLTIMQRRVDLNVNDCGFRAKYADYIPEDCQKIQEYTNGLNKTCPVL